MTEPLGRECTAVLTSISVYLDGELEAVECTAIERHCGGCRRCAALVEGLRHTIGLCREVGTAPLPEPLRARARESVRRLLDTAERPPSE